MRTNDPGRDQTAAKCDFDSADCDIVDFADELRFHRCAQFPKIGEFESGKPSRAPSARSTRQPGRASPGSFAPAATVCTRAVDIDISAVDFRRQADRQHRVRRALDAVAGIGADIDAERRVAARGIVSFAADDVVLRAGVIDDQRLRRLLPASAAAFLPPDCGTAPARARPTSFAPDGDFVERRSASVATNSRAAARSSGSLRRVATANRRRSHRRRRVGDAFATMRCASSAVALRI